MESVEGPWDKNRGKPEKAKDKPLVNIPEEKVYISRNDEAKVNNIVPEIRKITEASEKFCKRSPEQILTETETANEAIYDTLTGAYNRDYFDKTVAEYGDKNNDIESLINDADKALYAAKKNGRNQVHELG